MELISVIKYEGSSDVLVYKYPKEDINFGSQLIVHEAQEAIFMRDGQIVQVFSAGRYTLETKNFPVLKGLIRLGTGGENVFHAEIFFINLTTQMGLLWGTDDKVRLFDPASGLNIDIGASGSFNLRIDDSKKLLTTLVGTSQTLLNSDIAGGEDNGEYNTGKFRSAMVNRIKAHLARVIKAKNINILEIDAYLDVLSSELLVIINQDFQVYGLFLPEFYVTTVQTPDDDPNFQTLRQQFADRTLKIREEQIKRDTAEAAQQRKMVEAQTEAQLKMMGAQGDAEALRIRAQAEADAYLAKARVEAEEMKMKGYTYQEETARQVGMEAMKNGITGGSGSGSAAGGLGDVASLGVTLGAMGGVINMTREAMNPIMQNATQMGQGFGNAVSGNPSATQATAAPVAPAAPAAPVAPVAPVAPSAPVAPAAPVEAGWNCTNCGKTGITSRFCPDCGTPCPTQGAN